MATEATYPEPGAAVAAQDATGPVTAGRAAVVTVFGILATMMSAFDSISRNLAMPFVIKEFHLSVGTVSNLVALGFLVTFAGNQVIGPLMDKIGRKRAYQLTLLAAGVTSGVTAFVTNAWQFGVVAALSGTCLVILSPAGVMVAEESPAKARGILMALVQGSFSAGSLVLGVVGQAVLPGGHWRMLFLIGFAPLVMVVVGQFVLREPLRSAEARRVKREGAARGLTFKVDVERARRSEWRQLFEPGMRRQTVVLCVGGFLINYSPIFILGLSATYFEMYDHIEIGTISLALMLEGIGSIVGAVLLGFISRWIRVRDLLVVFSLLGAVTLALFGIHAGATQVLVLMTAYGVLGQGFLGIWGRYIADSYPTRMRGTAMGFVMSFFFLSSVVAPVMFGQLIGGGHFATTAIAAGVFAFAGGIVLFFGKPHAPRAELEELAV